MTGRLCWILQLASLALLGMPRSAFAQDLATLVDGTAIPVRMVQVDATGRVEWASDPPRTAAFDDLLTLEFGGQPPAQADDRSSWTLTTRDEDRLHVDQPSLRDEQFTLPAAWSASPLAVPIDHVARGAPTHSNAALADDDVRWRPDPARDKLLLLDGDRIDVVVGFLTAIGDGRLEFEVDGVTRRIPLTSVRAFIMAAPEPPDAPQPPARDARTRPDGPTHQRQVRVELHDGSLLHGHSFTCREEIVELTGGGGLRIAIRRHHVRRVDCQSRRVVWLSDLQPTDVVQSSQVSIPRDWRRDQSVFGGPLAIGAQSYRRGLGLQASTRLDFPAPRDAQTLLFEAGIDSAAGDRGDCELVVTGDGVEPLVRRRLRGGAPAVRISVPVAGVRRLRVAVESGAHFDLADQVVLGDARFVLRGESLPATPAPGR